MNFYVEEYFSIKQSHKKVPYVELVIDNWDDFYVGQTLFHAYYMSENNIEIMLGDIKIQTTKGNITRHHIERYFTQLDDTFCSLGQTMSYYKVMMGLDETIRNKILSGLNDAAIYEDIGNKFKDTDVFKVSLLRYSEAKMAFENAKRIMLGYVVETKAVFSFKCLLEGANSLHYIDFDFTEHKSLPYRINAFVGKNGTGKTKVLSELACSLSGFNNSGEVIPELPSFTKYIAISYSAFDDFNKPFNENYNYIKDLSNYIDDSEEYLKNLCENMISYNIANEKLYQQVKSVLDIFNDMKKSNIYKKIESKDIRGENESTSSYIYCGLRNKKGIITQKELKDNFIRAYKKIKKLNRENEWKNIIFNIVECEHKDIISELIRCINDQKDSNSILDKLSSGQNIMVFVMTEVIANIEMGSLLLFDEPEVHLHPNAISNFMRMLYQVLERFDSYAILSTHSPIIVQEIPARSIRVFKRFKNIPYVDKPFRESFGENISIITNEIFDVREVESNYKTYLRNLKESGMNYEQIINLFEKKLSFNALTYLNSIYVFDDEEEGNNE